jgi:hypothetical protein
MPSFRHPLRSVVFACLALAAAGAADAQLAANSPFLPAPTQGPVGPAENTPLELRGMTAGPDGTLFSIFDPVKKTGVWVRLNEGGYDFLVRKYNPDNDTVTIDYQGRTMTVAMRTPKVASSGIVAMAAPPAMNAPSGPPAPPNPVTRNVVVNPTPATEAARLADWTAEIQRRRNLREQSAAQPGAAPVTGAAPPPAAEMPAQTPATAQRPRGASQP